MAGGDLRLLVVFLVSAVSALHEKHGNDEPPVSGYSLPSPAASGPAARALTSPKHASLLSQATPYRFEYEVASEDTGDQKSASETRSEDGVVRGQYSYVDPTGALRTVRYSASESTGFVVEQELVPGFADPPPVRSALRAAGAAPLPRTMAPEEGQKPGYGEHAGKQEEEVIVNVEGELNIHEEKENEHMKEDMEHKSEKDGKGKMEEDAEQKRAEAEKKQAQEKLKEDQELNRKLQELKRLREAAKERERLRRLFGVAQPQLAVPAPLVVESPTLTLLRSRPAFVPPVRSAFAPPARPVFVPPAAGVRIRGRGINIAY
ncbi:uncharacterized protein LOC122372251 [Amphibalanus amphitrite]|uniref:uncharacterized protein LOC122372251 n=1 Tax=Amphibalanus amphitrite TaxID=1232801 RepID=UPI001C924A6C|nr:uncharacterized protein LOC122372251 [Amphibalanus amphitrite]